ncbi:MAG: signal peptidase I [Thermoanaerobacteraceae bacterium]|nr:signal peptidase I [Thermoanaerobacteraceae bacterium]
MTRDKERKSVIKTVLNILSNIIIAFLGLLIIYMLFFMFTNMNGNEPPTILNHQLYIVQSNSMSPTFKTGSLLIIKHVDTHSIEVGDIITFRKKNDSVSTTHRVVEIIDENNTRQFITRGDANNMNDPTPVDENHVLGKVTFFITLLGYVMGFIRTKQGTLLVIVIPAFIIMITQIVELFKYRKKYKSEIHEKDIKSET